MNKRIEIIIKNIYENIYKTVYSKKNVTSLSNGHKNAIRRTVLDLENSEKFKQFAERFAKRLAAIGVNRQKGLWRKYYAAAKSKHIVGLPDTYKKFELQILQKAVEHNFKMIKSIPQHVLDLEKHVYVNTLIDQVARGKISRGQFEKQLRSHGFKNAKVIARTETAKLQTAITENESRDLGSVAYIWRSSHDQRTRPSHKAMNDVIVFWRPDTQKPLLDNMRGNAGEFPNCRCDAHPIFDEDDLTKSTYQVYNYKTDKLIKVDKKDVIKMLERGKIERKR